MAHIKVASVVGNEINLPLDGEISAENATNTPSRRSLPEQITYETNIMHRGSYSTVYSGFLDGQRVAIKRIPLLDFHKDADLEEKVLLLCDHSNIVKLFEVDECTNYRYFALEWAVGSLESWSNGYYDGPLPANEEALMQLSKGLEYIHSIGFVHCNLKPSTVLISFHSISKPVKLMISGFRFCKLTTQDKTFLTSDDGRMNRGYEGWMAPEMWNADENSDDDSVTEESWQQIRCLSNAIDIWTLGCLFHFLITKGCHPFIGNKFTAIHSSMKLDTPIEIEKRLKEGTITPFLNCDIYIKLIHEMIETDPVRRISLDSVIKRLETIPQTSETRAIEESDPLLPLSTPDNTVQDDCYCCSNLKKKIGELELTIRELQKNIGATQMKIGEHPKESDVLTKISINPTEKNKGYGEISSLYQALECYFQAIEDLIGVWTEKDVNDACYIVTRHLEYGKGERERKYAQWYFHEAITFEGIPKDLRWEMNKNYPDIKENKWNTNTLDKYKAANLVNYLTGPIVNWHDQYREPQSPLFLLCLFASGCKRSFPPSGLLTLDSPLKITTAFRSVIFELGTTVLSDDESTFAQAEINLRKNYDFFKWLHSVLTSEPGCYERIRPIYEMTGNIFIRGNRPVEKRESISSHSSGLWNHAALAVYPRFAEIEPRRSDDGYSTFKLRYHMQ